MSGGRLEVERPLRESSDAGEDFIGRLGPHKRFAGLVVCVDEGPDGGFQRPDTAVDATLELLGGQRGEPAFD